MENEKSRKGKKRVVSMEDFFRRAAEVVDGAPFSVEVEMSGGGAGTSKPRDIQFRAWVGPRTGKVAAYSNSYSDPDDVIAWLIRRRLGKIPAPTDATVEVEG